MAAPGIQLRPFRSGDAPAVFEAVRESLDALIPWLPFAHADYCLDESREWVERSARQFDDRLEFQFAILDPAGRFVGGCGLNQIHPIHRMANLGYWVRSSATGGGIATAAVERVRAFAFEQTDLVRLEIVCAVGNLHSQRVAEKSGALREAILRDRLRTADGTTDAVMFALLRSEWEAPGAP